MTEHPIPDWPAQPVDTPPGRLLEDHTIGLPVWVRAFGKYRPGRIVAHGRTRIVVEYRRRPTGLWSIERRSFPPADIRTPD